MRSIRKITVKASRNYRTKSEKQEDEKKRKLADRSPLLLVLYLFGISGMIIIAGEAVGVSRSLYPMIIGIAVVVTFLLWFLYFYKSRLFIIVSAILIIGSCIIVIPEIYTIARYMRYIIASGIPLSQISFPTELLAALMFLALYLMFSLEFVLRNHFILFISGLVILAAIPIAGYRIDIIPMLLLMTFEIGFFVLNMTERRKLRDYMVNSKRARSSMISSLLTAALLTALFVPCFIAEQCNEEEIFHNVYLADGYLQDLLARITGAGGESVSGGNINRGNLHQTGEPILEVRLDKRPRDRIYLHSFRGKDYNTYMTGGRSDWGNAYELLNYYQNNYTETVYQESFMHDLMAKYLAKKDLLSTSEYAQLSSLFYPTSDPVSEMYFMLADGTFSMESMLSDYIPEGGYEYGYYGTINANDTLRNTNDIELSVRHINERYNNALYIPYYCPKSEGRIWGNGSITRERGYTTPFMRAQDISMEGKWSSYGIYEDFVNDYITATEKEYRSYPSDTFERLEKYCRETPLATIDEITTYILVTLQNKASYSTTPGTTPYNRDVIDYFLFDSGRGYCVHFASAATLMYRMYGVPARYVSGFVVEPSDLTAETDDTGTHYIGTITDYSAHAWVEIFLKDYGWVPVEVTPNDAGIMQASFPGYDQVTMRSIMNKHGWKFRSNASYIEGEGQGLSEQVGTVIRYSVMILPIAALFAAAAFFLIRRRIKLKNLSTMSCRRLFDLMIRLLHSNRLLTDMNGSEKDFCIRLSEVCTCLTEEDCKRIIDILTLVNYSESKASREDRDFLEHCYRQLSRELYEKSPPPRRLKLKFINGYL